MPNHDDYIFNVSRAQILYAALDYRSITKGKQRLEGAHPARAPGGEDHSGDVSHAKS